MMNREAWLNAMAAEFAPLYEALGRPLPEKLRISCGFCKGRKAIGECHYPEGSRDGTTEIFIHPENANPIAVGEILLHELAHAALGRGFGHGPEFKQLATGVGLTGKMTKTVGGQKAIELIEKAIEFVGPYPHASLSNEGPAADGPIKKATPAFKNMNCPSCGFHAKVRVDQMHLGRLRCPVDRKLLLMKGETRTHALGHEPKAPPRVHLIEKAADLFESGAIK